MSYEEKASWVQGIVAVLGYGVYLAIILSRVGGGALVDVPYVDAMLWTIGAAIVAGIVGGIFVGIASRGRTQKDQRDREINRLGEYTGQSFVVMGALAAMVLAMLEVDWFWIANVVYLCFVLSAILGSATKLAAYRRDFSTW